jgi:hypothetical protein
MMGYYYSGQGKVQAAIRDVNNVPQGFYELGNCSVLQLIVGANMSRYAVGGSQSVAKAVRPSEVPSFVLTMDEYLPDNLASVIYGQTTAVVGTTITNEVIVGFPGKSMPLANISLSSFTSLTNAGGTITYVRDTDYTIDLPTGMITFGSVITNAQSLRASYVFKAHTKVGAGTTAPPYLWLRLNGVNTADNNNPVVVDVFKVRFYPVDALNLISDGLDVLSIRGRIFYDRAQADNLTDGRFFRVRKG